MVWPTWLAAGWRLVTGNPLVRGMGIVAGLFIGLDLFRRHAEGKGDRRATERARQEHRDQAVQKDADIRRKVEADETVARAIRARPVPRRDADGVPVTLPDYHYRD